MAKDIFHNIYSNPLSIKDFATRIPWRRAVGALLGLCLLTSCSTTSHIPDDDQLFVGLKKIEYADYKASEHADQTREELEAALATEPNGALFGSSYYRTPLPYRLWIWNATTGSHGVFKKWMNKSFGKPPVLMSQVNPALRAQVARQVLRTRGYMHGDVTYEEITQKNPKKAKIAYTVRMDSLFTIDSVAYVGFPQDMQRIIDSTLQESAMKKGTPLSVPALDAERTRLSQLMRNEGYYYWQTTYAQYLADTLQKPLHAQLRLQMADSLPQAALRPWHIGKTSVTMRRTIWEQADSTIERRFLKLAFSGKHPPISPRAILSGMKLRPRMLYSYDAHQESMAKVNATGVFQQVDFRFTPREDGTDTLDLVLDCILDKPWDVYFETNLINRTIGRFGPEMKIGVTRRNAFRGGEKIDVNLHGAYEWEKAGGGSDMNSYQYGADAAVEFPRTLFPKIFQRKRQGQRRRMRQRFYATPWTVAKVSSDIIRRPGYYKMHIVSGEWTYRWQKTATSKHELSPLTVKYQFLNSHTLKFDSLLISNPYLTATMSDYFIPKMRYTYTYASPTTMRNPLRWETTIEEAGNITALYDVIVQGNGWNQKDKTLFKNPYSQFLKIETDLTKTWTLAVTTKLVGHLNYGLMWSYGNSNSGPFSEKFYVGGANSIRAYPVRSIGPGGFPGLGGDRQFAYLMQNGDVKIVMNLELRQRLFGSLYGAVFVDAGNVWSSEDWTIHSDEEEAKDIADAWNSIFGNNKFRMKNFLRQVATGTGVGIRYDLDFLVLRLDWGFGLHLPYDTGKSGYFNITRFKDMHTLHLAIGYPF